MPKVTFKTELCKGCGLCVIACPKKILVIADKNTIKAADGILDSLTGFDIVTHIYDDLRVATMDEVRLVENYIDNGVSAVLAFILMVRNDGYAKIEKKNFGKIREMLRVICLCPLA